MKSITAVTVTLFALAVLLAQPVQANEKEACPTPLRPLSKNFEQLKELVGRWEGTDPHHPEEKAVLEYKLTAGGTALVETLFPGKPHEMVSVYHDRNGRPMMVHYCMLGNQPQLDLINAEPNQLTFEMKGEKGLGSSKEMHMHALTITWKDANHIEQNWTSFQNGKKKESSTIVLTRVN